MCKLDFGYSAVKRQLAGKPSATRTRLATSLLAIALISDGLIAQDAELTLAGGQSIPARVATLDDDGWTVSSPIFEGDARIEQNAVKSLRFLRAVGEMELARETFRIQLRSGEVLVGEIRSWSEDVLKINHVDLGQVTVPSKQVIDVVRFGEENRALTAADLSTASTASASNLGSVLFKQGDQLTTPFELASDSLVRMSFKLEELTEFRVLLNEGDKTIANVQVSADGILSEAGDSIEFADCELRLGIEQLSLHSSSGKLTLRDRLGQQVLSQKLSSKSPLTIQIVNDGGSLEILQVDLSASCKATVVQDFSTASVACVLASGEVEFGSTIGINESTIQLQTDVGAKDLSLQDVVAIEFPKRTFYFPDHVEAAVLWGEGTRVFVRDVKIEDSVVILESQRVSSESDLKASFTKAIYFTGSKSGGNDSSYQLTLGDSTYRGRFEWDTSNTDLNWKFDGFSEAVRLKEDRKISITGFSTAGSAVPVDLDRLLLENGTVLPCRVVSISEDSVSFQSQYFEATEVPIEFFKGCFLASHDGGPEKTITKESIRRAMMIPRFARDLEPQHILIANNGDLLRGTLVSMDEKKVAFDSRAELLRINRERIHAIISLNTIDDSAAQDQQAALGNAVKLECGDDFVMVGRLLSTQQTLVMDVPGCGECRIPRDDIRAIRRNSSHSDLSQLYAYTRWTPESAIEPRWTDPPAPQGNAQELVGKLAQEIELETVTGETFRLSDHRGKVVVLDFWATWCKPCLMGMPGYLEAMNEFSPEEAIFVAVNLGEPASTVEKFLKNVGWKMPVPLDTQSQAASKYNVSAIPHLVIIDSSGKIAEVKVGYSPDSAEHVRSRVQELLSN